jgi:hypothetical protein
MDEQQVRALVRQAIARHMAPGAAPALVVPPRAQNPPAALDGHGAATAEISHARFALARPAGEVECLIEPAVTCTHCGYCQCYGH